VIRVVSEVAGAEPASWAGLESGGGGSTISTSSTSSSSESISRALLGVRRSVGAGARGGNGSAISIKAASAGKECNGRQRSIPRVAGCRCRRLQATARATDDPLLTWRRRKPSRGDAVEWRTGGPRLITRGKAEPVGCDGEGWVVADGGGDRRTELVVATVKSSLISSHVQPEELQVGCKDRAGGGVRRSVTG